MRRPARRVPEEPASGDGAIVANSGQLGGLFEASGYLPLNSGERQFAAKRLAPQLAPPNLSPESEARRMGKVG